MEDLEQERKQKRREALEEYQKIISYEIIFWYSSKKFLHVKPPLEGQGR